MALNTLNKPSVEGAAEQPRPQEKSTTEKLTPHQHLLKLFEAHALTPQQSREVYAHAINFVNPETPEEVLLATYATSLDQPVLDTLMDLRHDRLPETAAPVSEELVDPAAEEGELNSGLEARADVEAIIGEFMTQDTSQVPQLQEVFAVARQYADASGYTVDNLQNAFGLMARAEGMQGQFAQVLANNLEQNRASLETMSPEDLESFLNSFGL